MYDTTPFAYDVPPPRPQKKWYQRKLVLIPSGLFGAFLLIGIIGAATGAGQQKQKDAAAPAPVTVERTVTAPAPTPSSSSAPVVEPVVQSTAAPASTSIARKAVQRPKAAPVQSVKSWTMPDEVGNDLQGAQDHIQSITGDGIFFTDSEDATGAGRMQILDRNWQVCSQNIREGSRITADSDIMFSVVKFGESCP